MKNIKNFINKINTQIDIYLPLVPNWMIWTAGLIVIYLIVK